MAVLLQIVVVVVDVELVGVQMCSEVMLEREAHDVVGGNKIGQLRLLHHGECPLLQELLLLLLAFSIEAVPMLDKFPEEHRVVEEEEDFAVVQEEVEVPLEAVTLRDGRPLLLWEGRRRGCP